MKFSKNIVMIMILGAMLPILALACRLAVPEDTDAQPIIEMATAVPAVIVSTPVQIEEQQSQTILPGNETNTQIVSDEEQVLAALYARVNPAVVNITTYSEQEGQVLGSGQGSGFVFDQEGHIVTNAHVVHGSDQLDVAFSDGTIKYAEIVGEDLHSDLAVIKVDSLPDGVLPISLGNMDEVAVGQTVVAIGNPFGLGGTLTRGIVSALGRTIPALTSFSIPKAIQTDAPINPGNSGGPLLNLEGEIIGVNAQIETGGLSRSNSGVGFAIPVNIVQRVVPGLISQGSYDWAWLGVRGGDLNPIVAEAMNLLVDKGAYISSVLDNGPSSAAGLRGSNDSATIRGRDVEIGGDVIIAIDGTPVNSFDDLLIYIALNANPGSQVTLTILRNGEQRDITVTLEARPASLQNALP